MTVADGQRPHIRFACPRCDTEATDDPLVWRCPTCGGALEIDGPAFSFSGAGPEGDGVWRYRSWLPVEPAVALGEPTTPLVRLPWRGADITVKLEAALPTGSFKDRGSAALVSWLVARGVRSVAEDSSGNAGASLAAYCARAGITCDIFAPATASPAKLTQIQAYGATVHLIPGPRIAATDAAIAAVERGVVYASHIWNPLSMVGTATFAFELIEQLAGRAPDVLVLPVGAGTLTLGVARAFAALVESGRLSRSPRIFAVQSEACAPLALADARGSDEPAAVTPGPSVAEGIMLASPPRGGEILRRLRATGGGVIAVDDPAIWTALSGLARLGVYVEPTSATAVAGLDALRATGRVSADEEVVVALTGSGLKAGDRIRTALFS